MDEMCADARRASSALDPRAQVQDRIPWFQKFLGRYSRRLVLSFEFGVLSFGYADTPTRSVTPWGACAPRSSARLRNAPTGARCLSTGSTRRIGTAPVPSSPDQVLLSSELARPWHLSRCEFHQPV